MKTRKNARYVPSLLLTLLFLLSSAQSRQTPQPQPPAKTQKIDQSKPAPENQAQQPAQPQKPEDVPVTDGGAGPCSIELTVIDSDAKPVFSALVNVHMAYGFVGAHKLDMGVYTNTQGKGKFTGIPAKVRNPPIEFRATKGTLAGTATMDPVSECQAKHEIILQKSGN